MGWGGYPATKWLHIVSLPNSGSDFDVIENRPPKNLKGRQFIELTPLLLLRSTEGDGPLIPF